MERKLMIAVLRDFVGRFELVCRDADGNIDPADVERITAVNKVIRALRPSKARTRG
jgi:hypothetical protein